MKGETMNKLILICALLVFTTPAFGGQGKAIELDNGTWKYQRLKIKDLDTGKTKKIKYRIHGVNRDRIKVYDYDTKEIKRYKIRR